MKKLLTIFCLLVLTGTLAAEANNLFRPNAVIYDETKLPFAEYFDSKVKPLKTGEANCINYFMLVTKGDCSIKKAMDDAGITKINSIDRLDKSILLYDKITLLVHGE